MFPENFETDFQVSDIGIHTSGKKRPSTTPPIKLYKVPESYSKHTDLYKSESVGNNLYGIDAKRKNRRSTHLLKGKSAIFYKNAMVADEPSESSIDLGEDPPIPSKSHHHKLAGQSMVEIKVVDPK